MIWRPRWTRVIAYTTAGVIVLGMIALAVVLPAPYGPVDRVGIVLFGCGIAWLLHKLAHCRVSADEQGVTVVNPFRTHRYAWAQVLGVHMAVGDPWPTLDLADGNSIGAMGIQGAERAFAARATAELQGLLRQRGETTEPGA